MRILALALAGLLAGCASPQGKVGENAARFNQELEGGANRVILLNILRAGARLPLYFSSLSSIDSREAGDLELGLELPLERPGRDGGIFPILSLEDSTPRFSVSSKNRAGFYRSMLRPIELGVVESLLARRWPQELVLTLVVSEIGWGGDLFINEVGGPGEAAFRRRLRLLLALGLSAEPLLGDNTLIEDLGEEAILDLIEERGLDDERLQIVPDRVTGKFDLIGEAGGFRLCFRLPPIYELDALNPGQIARAIDLTCRTWVVSNMASANLGGRDANRLTREQKVKLAHANVAAIERGRGLLERIDQRERPPGDEAELVEMIEGLVARSETSDQDGVGEQELGRLEHFGELALTLRAPLEIFDYLGALAAPVLRREAVEPLTIWPDLYYRGGGPCDREQADPRCLPLVLFRVRPGEANHSAAQVEFIGRPWRVDTALSEPRNRSTDVLSLLATVEAIFTEAGDVDDIPRVTVLP